MSSEPPNTYENSTTNMIGWISPKMTTSGMRIMRIRLRLATTSESRTERLKAFPGTRPARIR